MCQQNFSRRRHQFERLEDRQMMAADIILGGANGDTLYVHGTDDADRITVEEVVESVQYKFTNPRNGHSYAYTVDVEKVEATIRDDSGNIVLSERFNASDVDSIRIWAHDGDDDVFNNTSKRSYIRGGRGSDLLVGGSADDNIRGDEAFDLIFGRAGNDTLRVGRYSGDPDDMGGAAFGGEGADTLYGADFAGRRDQLIGGSGNDSIYAYDGIDWIVGDKPDENWWPDADNDRWREAVDMALALDDSGTDGNDYIRAGAGDDQVWGGGGNDTIRGDAGNDLIWGGRGDDVIRGDAGFDSLFGQEDNDELHGGDDVDYMEGGDGDDLLAGGNGIDIMWGNDGDDEFYFTVEDIVDGLPGWSTWRWVGAAQIIGGEYAGHFIYQDWF